MARKLAIIAFVALSAALSLLPGRPTAAAEPLQFSRPSQASPVFGTTLTAKPGDLDRTFDGDGKVFTDLGGTDEVDGVVAQPDGKIVAAGYSQNPVTYDVDFALARYNPDGSLDATFGNGGKVRTDFGGSWAAGLAVTAQPDGKIVVAGNAYMIPGITYYTDVALARYNADGTLDPSFGTNGKVVTNLRRSEWASDVAIQPDGKIVVVGGSRAIDSVNGYDFAVARYTPNGDLDTTFGGSGFVITAVTSGWDQAEAVLIQPDGKIVAAGGAAAEAAETQHLALVRYNPDGTPDSAFGGVGTVEGRNGEWGWDLARQADGKFVVAAEESVLRFNPTGSLDTGFGSNGAARLTGDAFARAVLVQADRKLVAAGTVYTGQNADFLAARLEPNGSTDTSFGDKGRVHTDIGEGTYDDFKAALLQRDRRIVLAGRTQPNSQTGPVDFALVRYLNPAPCRVPNVRGKKLAVARTAMTKAHCRVGKVKRKASKRVKRNRVISQSPKAGTTLPNLGKVNLVVSRGWK